MISQILSKMILYFDGDVKRINHALKVYSFAETIGGLESLNPENRRVLSAAAVLHDIGIKESERKYNSSAGKYQELEGPPVAEAILKELGFEAGEVERICFLIGNHHSYDRIDGMDFQILVEADFIVNIFEDGIDAKAIGSVKSKFFRTKAGTRLLESMYKI